MKKKGKKLYIEKRTLFMYTTTTIDIKKKYTAVKSIKKTAQSGLKEKNYI